MRVSTSRRVSGSADLSAMACWWAVEVQIYRDVERARVV